MNQGNAQTTQGKPLGQSWVVLRLRNVPWRGVAAWAAIALASAFAGGAAMLAVLMLQERPAAPAAVVDATEQPSEDVAAAPDAPAEPAARRIIDGAPLEAAQEPGRYFAVVIDNLTIARPQAGIAAAP